MATQITVKQLEQMTTHELANMLSEVVFLLRRLPNVKWQDFQQTEQRAQTTTTQQPQEVHPHMLMLEELKKMRIPDLQEIAKDLHMHVPARIKKDDLISRIIARQGRQDYNHSEQYAIQDI
jgi:hypothetical protein